MKVADSRPASCPGVASSTSMSNPRLSAHRVYMRNIISAQSCASVPPAPAWISATASPSSCGPAKRERNSSGPRSRSRLVEQLAELRPQGVIGFLFDQFVERLGVGQLLGQSGQLVEVLVDPAQLGGHLAGVIGVVPQSGLGDLLLQLGTALEQPVTAQEVSGLGQTPPQ